MLPLNSRSTTRANNKAYLSSQRSYTTCRYPPNNRANAIDEDGVMSAGDEEHDVLSAW